MIIILLKLKKILQFKRIYNSKFKKDCLKLNLGCGGDYKQGWINIDNDSHKLSKRLDLKWDLNKGIPFEDASIDYIFNEHFLEHLSVSEGLKFLKECKRVLKKGGVLRIAMPDLENTIKEYFNPNWKDAPVFKKFHLEYIKTKAERINISFRGWGHQWLYDREELERRLREVGFEKIKFCNLRISEHLELNNLETREESTK